MNRHEKLVKLEKAARKTGGDRYIAEDGFQVYVPQEISRPNGQPVEKLLVIFETP